MSAIESSSDAASYEERHVHNVYHQIAPHFSSTRHKPWPVVETFLRSLPPGSVGVDVGCGNGKYLPVNKDVFIVASDRSAPLVDIAREHQPHCAVIADILNLPHPHASFDFAVSIAVVHHLSTRARRVAAIKASLELLKPLSAEQVGGQVLIFAWALEQGNSRRGWNTGDNQDVLVPWVLKGAAMRGEVVAPQQETFQRYYHLYQKGELEVDVVSASGEVIKAGYDRDNWWVVAGARHVSCEQ